jgi:hypothetical protein
MLDVEPGQIWKIRSNANSAWRRVHVAKVAGDIVELEYFEVSEAFDMHQMFMTSRSAMLLTAANYQFVANAPAGGVPRKRVRRVSAHRQHRSSG